MEVFLIILIGILLLIFIISMANKGSSKFQVIIDSAVEKQNGLMDEVLNDQNFKIDKKLEIKRLNYLSLESGLPGANLDPSSYILLDDTNKLFWILAAGDDKIRKYNYSELIEFEVKEDGVSIVSGRVGSSIVGGLAFGVTGAIIGSSGSKTVDQKINELTLNIRVSNFEKPSIKIAMVNKPTFKKDLKYKELMTELEEVISYLTFIKNYNETK